MEERVICQISIHIPLYEGRQYRDLSAEEKSLVDKDVEYIKSIVSLISADQIKEVED